MFPSLKPSLMTTLRMTSPVLKKLKPKCKWKSPNMFAQYQNGASFLCCIFSRKQDVKRWRTWRGQGSYTENVSCRTIAVPLNLQATLSCLNKKKHTHKPVRLLTCLTVIWFYFQHSF